MAFQNQQVSAPLSAADIAALKAYLAPDASKRPSNPLLIGYTDQQVSDALNNVPVQISNPAPKGSVAALSQTQVQALSDLFAAGLGTVLAGAGAANFKTAYQARASQLQTRAQSALPLALTTVMTAELGLCVTNGAFTAAQIAAITADPSYAGNVPAYYWPLVKLSAPTRLEASDVTTALSS